jgi:hypothetical protein
MNNVPQDVIDELEKISQDIAVAGINGFGNRISDAVSKLRAQRQQGAEPVAWKDIDLDGMAEAFSRVIDAHHSKANPFHGTIDRDAKVALRILRGIIPAMKSYTTPPQANALVAAAYRKAAELIMPKEGGYVSPKLRHLTAAADEVSKLNAEIILNSIPADAEAALREVIADAVAAGADNIEGYDLTNIKPWDDVVNSVMEGKDDE